MRGNYIIITNNPLVLSNLGGAHSVAYKDVSYEEILKEVRDHIHQGQKLLSHPLSGSVKPNETPYKSVLVAERKTAVDEQSVSLIESAILACRKFVDKSGQYKPETYDDFQLIDFTLIQSALASADV